MARSIFIVPFALALLAAALGDGDALLRDMSSERHGLSRFASSLTGEEIYLTLLTQVKKSGGKSASSFKSRTIAIDTDTGVLSISTTNTFRRKITEKAGSSQVKFSGTIAKQNSAGDVLNNVIKFDQRNKCLVITVDNDNELYVRATTEEDLKNLWQAICWAATRSKTAKCHTVPDGKDGIKNPNLMKSAGTASVGSLRNSGGKKF